MDFKELFSKKRLIFIALFIALVYAGNKINFSPLIGANNQFFTLFQFFGPIAGSFLGPIFGGITVLGAELIDFVVVGKAFTLINIARLLPMIAAAYYFGTNRKKTSALITIVAAIVFLANPVGLQSWFMALYWTIPVIISLTPMKYSNNLLLKSLGATLTAHAVGSAAWAWSVPMTKALWLVVFSVAWYERLVFALGIAGSYIIINTVLDVLITKFNWSIPEKIISINKKLVLKSLLKF